MIAASDPLHLKAVETANVDREYRRHRRSVFTGIFVGYAAYYLVRNNLALAIPDILPEYPQHSKAELGWALTGLSISYGVSKFLMGSVSDRSNPKYFLPLGLLLSCAIMFVSGVGQGDLRLARRWSSCCRSPTAGCRAWAGRPAARRWCTGSAPGSAGSSSRSGTSSHNVGGGAGRRPWRCSASRCSTTGARSSTSTPRSPRSSPSSSFFLMRDTPQSCGLPPVEEYKNDYPPTTRARSRADVHLPRDLLRARAEQPLSVGDRGRQRVRLLRPLRRRELDPDLPPDRQGLLVPAVEHRLGALRVRGDSRHDRLRLDVGQGLQGPPRAGDDPVHGADAGRGGRLLAEPATARCGSTTPR